MVVAAPAKGTSPYYSREAGAWLPRLRGRERDLIVSKNPGNGSHQGSGGSKGASNGNSGRGGNGSSGKSGGNSAGYPSQNPGQKSGGGRVSVPRTK